MKREFLLSEQDSRSPEMAGNLIPAVGNHEPKALLCLAMKPGIPYTRGDLKNLLREIQGDNAGWDMSDSLGWDYCMGSLAPIGFVAKEIIDLDKGIVGFAKTPFGENIGEAVCGHFLDYSLEHPETSLYRIFGATNTRWESSNRSPITRVEIFGELLTRQQPIRITDLLNNKVSSRAKQHVLSMARDGLINFSGQDINAPIAKYSLGDVSFEDIPKQPKKSRFPGEVRDVILNRLSNIGQDEITLPEIVGDLILQTPEYGKIDGDFFRRKTAATLRRFSRHGAVKYVGKFGKDQRTEITLTPDQEKILSDCLELVWAMEEMSPEFIERGRAEARKILADKHTVSKLMAKAKNASPHANSKTLQERADELSAIISMRPGCSTSEIVEQLDAQGIRLTEHTTASLLRTMEIEESLRREIRNRKSAWFVIGKL
jgi:hypothetical protein